MALTAAGKFYPVPIRTPMYETLEDMKAGRLSQAWVSWFTQTGGAGRRTDDTIVDSDLPNAPVIAVIPSRDANGMIRLTIGAEAPTLNGNSVVQTRFQLSKDDDSDCANPFYDRYGPSPYNDVYMTTEVTTFYARACVQNAKGWGPWSAILTVSTEGDLQASDTDVPGVPQNLTLIVDDVDASVPGNELVIEWDAPAANLTTLFAYGIEIDTDADFPSDSQLYLGSHGVAQKGKYTFSDPVASFIPSWVGRTLWVYDGPVDGQRVRTGGKILSVDSPTQVTLDSQLRLGGTDLNYEIIVPSFEQVVRALTVPTQILDPAALPPSSRHRYVATGLPLTNYYVRIRATNAYGMSAWCTVAGPAALDGLKGGDLESSFHELVVNSFMFVVSEGTFSDNTPLAGSIAWSGVKVQYGNAEYTIADGNTNLKWLYWDPANPTVFTGSATVDLTGLKIGVALNASGTYLSQWRTSDIVDGERLRTGSVDITPFASGIRPVEIVSSLPGTGNFAGRIVFLTTDNKLYRYNGSAWTSAVPAADLTGQIITTQITDDAITTAKLNALCVTSNELAANSVIAGKIATGAVSADQIAANAVTAGKIAAGSITVGDMGANAMASYGLFNEVFEGGETEFERRWDWEAKGTVTFPANGVQGGLVLRAVGATTFLTEGYIPFDPDILYRVQTRVRRISTPQTGLAYCNIRLRGYNASKSYIGYAEYSVNTEPWTVNVWQVLTFWVKGLGTGGTGTATDPYKLTTGTKYVKPAVYLNSPGSTTNTTEIDSVTIQGFDQDGQNRLYLALESDGMIAANKVDSDSIAANSIVAAKISAGEIYAAKIHAEAIEVTHMSSGAVSADRGDPSGYDYSTETFTQDSTWHTLDISSIVPAGRRFVAIRFFGQAALSASEFRIAKNGNYQNYNCAKCRGYSAINGGWCAFDVVTACDADRKIYYYSLYGSWTYIYLTIAGWWS